MIIEIVPKKAVMSIPESGNDLLEAIFSLLVGGFSSGNGSGKQNKKKQKR